MAAVGTGPHHPGPLLPPPSPRPGEEGGVSAGCCRRDAVCPRPWEEPKQIRPISPSSPGRSGGRPGEEGRGDEGQRTEDANLTAKKEPGGCRALQDGQEVG